MSDYPLSDSTSIAKVRKAAKEYRCPSAWAHDQTIKRGEFYARVKITPGMGYGWREETYHLECRPLQAKESQ
ncbi:MAG TPA: hypothetical protein DEV93_03490 [Chloroflexi bacterium]|nr:hypothetical protein [Chloroflexota bacterium]